MDPSIDDKIGDTTLLSTAVAGELVGFAFGAAANDVVAMSVAMVTEAVRATGAAASGAVTDIVLTSAAGVFVCAVTLADGASDFLVLSDDFFEVLRAVAPPLSISSEWAPPELDTVTPGATSTVDDEGDFVSDSSTGAFASATAPSLSPPSGEPWLVSVDTTSGGDEVAEPSTPVSADGLDGVSESAGAAQACPAGAATAIPTPSATAKPPMRPTYLL